MRQADRWDEVAGLVVRYRDAGVVGFDLAGPEIGFPPDRIPSAIAHARPGRARTAPSTPARPPASRASAPPWTARTPSGWATASGSPTRSPTTARSGPLAQRVRDEQVPLEVAPSSNVQTGAYPSLAEHPVDRLHRLGFAVTAQHRQPADERGLGQQRVRRRRRRTFGWSWDDVQTVTERALAARLHPADAERTPAARPTVVRPGYAALRPDGG